MARLEGADIADLAGWQVATGGDAASLFGEPLFLDADGADGILGGLDGGADDSFELAAGSPAIDAGDADRMPATDALGRPTAR